MATTKPRTLFYIIVRTIKKPIKTKTITIYENGVSDKLPIFTKWLKEAIEEKVKK